MSGIEGKESSSGRGEGGLILLAICKSMDYN